jgi:hypothetical protein
MRTSLTCTVLLLVSLTGCQEEKSERVLLIEASTLAQTGKHDEAETIFAAVLETNPTSPDVLIRYAGFRIDIGDLDGAAQFFETLDSMELRGTNSGRANTERRRYYQAMYDAAQGDGPSAPADLTRYETAVIGLINVERAGPMVGEYNHYLLMQSRASLGLSPDDRIALNHVIELVDAVSEEQARASLGFLGRLIEGDVRAEVREELEPADQNEAEALRTAIRVKLFRDEFDTRWSTRYCDAFAADGRYSAATNAFTIHYVGPLVLEDLNPTPARVNYHAQTWHARELATNLAYELANLERSGAPPLPYSTPEFADTTVANLTADAEGNIVFDVTIPYSTVRQGAYLLHRRQLESRAEAQGSQGDDSPESDAAAEGSE